MAEGALHRPIRVLVIEDSQADAVLLREWLEESGSETYEIFHALTLSEALVMLSEHSFMAVMLDISLPDTRELEGLAHIHNKAPTVPVVILTGQDDEVLALRAVKNGAQDYLIKDKADGETVRRALRYAVQRKRFERGVIRQANFDRLTGLVNRILFESRLTMALARATRSGSLGLLFLDLDHFKQVNDSFGHAGGDQVLKEIGKRIIQCVRPYDTAARLGGDEFAVIIDGISQPDDCIAIAQKLIESIRKPVMLGRQKVEIGVSIGIETCTGVPTPSLQTVISHADEAMYRAKSRHGNAYCFYTAEVEEAQRRRAQIASDLGRAVHNNELFLCYQPKQSLATGQICGVEALLRWNHPQHGMMLPAEFMGIARDIHVLGDIEEWVLTRVCQDIERWRDIRLPFMQVSVNLSADWFESSDFIGFLSSLLAQGSMQADQLGFELPESVFSLADARHERAFRELGKRGIGITMNQFSGQMSSLQSLKAIVLREIKISSEFLTSVQDESESLRILKAIIACAHSLDLRVVACGVESEALRNYLREQECDVIQGYIYSRPMQAAYLEEWLQGAQFITGADMPAQQMRLHG